MTSPTGLKLSQQVRSEPAWVSVMKGAELTCSESERPERLNSEICRVVVNKDSFPSFRGERKPTFSIKRKAAVLSYVMAYKKGHHRGLRTGHVLTGVARELGRACLSPGNQIAGLKGLPADSRVPALRRGSPSLNERIMGKPQGTDSRATSEVTGRDSRQS